MKMEMLFLILVCCFLCQLHAFQSFKSGYKVRSLSKTTLADKPFKNFDEMLTVLEVPVLVDFYAEWLVASNNCRP